MGKALSTEERLKGTEERRAGICRSEEGAKVLAPLAEQGVRATLDGVGAQEAIFSGGRFLTS